MTQIHDGTHSAIGRMKYAHGSRMVELKVIRLNEINQAQKETCNVIPPMWNLRADVIE